jgi:hypothetical protein
MNDRRGAGRLAPTGGICGLAAAGTPGVIAGEFRLVNVVAVDHHIAEIDPDAEGNALILGDFGIALDHRALQLDSTSDGIDDAGKFHQHAVASGFDDAAAELLDLRIDQLAAVRFEVFKGAFLVGPHQPRVAGDVGR